MLLAACVDDCYVLDSPPWNNFHFKHGMPPRKKVVRIVPQVNLDEPDYDPTLLQLVRETCDPNQDFQATLTVHSQEAAKFAASRLSTSSRPSTASAEQKAVDSGLLECW